jgi:hypothetical protein
MLKKDIPGLRKLQTANSTADYVSITSPVEIDKGGVNTLAQTLTGLSAILLFDKITKAVSHIDRIVAGGSTAVVTINYVLGIIFTHERKAHTGIGHIKFEDTWVKRGNTWKLRASRETALQFSVDDAAATNRPQRPGH